MLLLDWFWFGQAFAELTAGGIDVVTAGATEMGNDAAFAKDIDKGVGDFA